MSEQELRRLLADAVPETGPRGELAAAARGWARRRRNRYVAIASMAVVAVAIAIPVALARESDQRVEPAPQPEVFSCPPAQERPTAPPSTATEPGHLSEGAVAVRLCNRYIGGYQVQTPVDALVGQAADDLATTIGSLGPLQPPKTCNLSLRIGGDHYFVFTYPDGHTESVTANEGSCGGSVTIEDGQARGSSEDAARIFEQFNTALLSQRVDQQSPPHAQTELHCQGRAIGGMSPLKTEGLPELTKAVLCWDRNLFSQQPTQEASFAADDLKLVLQSMNRDSRAPTSHPALSCERGSLNYQIIGENAWGDRYSLDGTCGVFDLRGYGTLQHWWPEGASADVLARMLATGTDRLTLPRATTSAEGVLFTWADLVNELDDRAGELWVDGQPTEAASRTPVSISPGKAGILLNGSRNTTTPGYAHSMEVDALWGDSTTTCPYDRAKTFVLVRQSNDEPWRILSWADHGVSEHGC